jgi:uncharacterized membrane protein YqjE
VADRSDPTVADSTLAGMAARLFAALAEGLQLRVELFGLELAEERQRLVDLVVSALATAVAVLLLAFSLSVLLLALFWDTHRIVVAAGLCLVYAAAAVGFGLRHRRMGRRLAPPFAATAAVLARDQETLRDIR